MYLPTEKKFYFMEMNTRIQVEHPVSGHQGGIQFIQTQFDLAEGKCLKSQEQLDSEERGGHTMEARMCFERFLPETERAAFRQAMGVDVVTMPESGRPIDALELPSGRDITVYMDDRLNTGDRDETGKMPNKQYDSMVIQIVVRGRNREAARKKLITAVDTLHVSGPQTNKAFVLRLLRHPLFIQGGATSDMNIVQEAMDAILAQSEAFYRRYAQEQRIEAENKRMAALVMAVRNGDIVLSEACAQWDLPLFFSIHLGLLKPTHAQIHTLLERLGLMSDDLWRDERREWVRFPLQLLVYDILETFRLFGVRSEPCRGDAPEGARFSVPTVIKPLFCGYLHVYGGVSCMEQ